MTTRQALPAPRSRLCAAGGRRRALPLFAAWFLVMLPVAVAVLHRHSVRLTRAEERSGRRPPRQARVDYTLSLPPGAGGKLSFTARTSGPATLLLSGLNRGGAVTISVNGSPPGAVELLASGGRRGTGADSALVSAALVAGRNVVQVTEGDGVQVVRVTGTNRWFATSTQAAGNAVFAVDLDDMRMLPRQYPVRVNYGPRWDGFFWFSGRWDVYYGEVYVTRFSRVRGSSGPDSASLSFVLEDPVHNLVMPTRLTLVPEPVSGALTIRVYQALRAVDDTTLGDGTEFLHTKLTDDGAGDWGDGATDYTWYRSQGGDCPDAAPGSHTGMVRLDDNTSRVYAFRSSSGDPQKTRTSDIHHTSGATPLAAVNTIGGYFNKAGVGSCGWVFHQYRANFRDDVTPVFGHCGDGADTHFFASCYDLYCPMTLKRGDILEAEYSLTMLPSEVTREEIEDLNEADLHFFGTEREQTATIAGWIGTKNAVGLRRSDGSLILLGLGREPARVAVPAATVRQAIAAYRLFGLAEPTYDYLELGRGTVQTRPGWITVIDCGAALWEPVPALGGSPDDRGLNGTGDQLAQGESEAVTVPWPQAAAGVPFEGMLRRKQAAVPPALPGGSTGPGPRRP